MDRRLERDGRSGAPGKAASLFVPLTVLVGTASAADITRGIVKGPLALVVTLVYGFLLLQCGRVYVRLSDAPLYPRASYFGAADIAPEPLSAEQAVRRAFAYWGIVALSMAVFAGAAISAAGLGAPVGLSLLAAGILTETWRGIRRGSSRLEKSLRGQYVLYLRSFSGVRFWVVLAVTLSAAPARVVAVLSPRRAEMRSPSWYLFGALFPVQFGRLHFWTTSNEQWNRVVSSLTHSSRAIIFDSKGVSDEFGGDGIGSGLALELGISQGHSAGHPTAYLTDGRHPLPWRVPVPSTLVISSNPVRIVGQFPRLVQRLRAVLTRQLSEDELAYLDQYYSAWLAAWGEATIRDRNLAAREGRRDPHDIIMGRDPMAEAQVEVRRTRKSHDSGT